MPENFLEINRYFAFTPYCNTIGQSNNALSILGFSLARKPRDHFSRSYENRSIYSKINSFTQRIYLSAHFLIWELPATCCLPFDNVYFQKISIPATEDTFVFYPPPPTPLEFPFQGALVIPTPPPPLSLAGISVIFQRGWVLPGQNISVKSVSAIKKEKSFYLCEIQCQVISFLDIFWTYTIKTPQI